MDGLSIFRELHHPEFRVANPTAMADRLKDLFGGVQVGPVSSNGSVLLELTWGAIELKQADENHPVDGGLLALEVRDNDEVLAFLKENEIEADYSKMNVTGNNDGPIFFEVCAGEDAIRFHTIIPR